MLKYFYIIYVASILLFISCDIPVGPSDENEENDIYELVLRDKFHNNASGEQNTGDSINTTIKVYFISVHELESGYSFHSEPQDPSDDLVGRFKDFHKKVKGISSHFLINSVPYDKDTGEKGLIFRVGGIRWKSQTEVELNCSYYSGWASADCFTYFLRKLDGKWYIQYKIFRWIS